MASACGTGERCKSAVSRSPQSHTTTRANIAHEIAEQIRARIACTPAEKCVAGVGLASALTGVTISLLQWEKVARFTATDEVSIMLIALSRQRRYQTHARQPYYAGVQTMRARICSAFSRAMFARVV